MHVDVVINCIDKKVTESHNDVDSWKKRLKRLFSLCIKTKHLVKVVSIRLSIINIG